MRSGEVFEQCGKGSVAGLEGKPIAWEAEGDVDSQGWKDVSSLTTAFLLNDLLFFLQLGYELENRHTWIFSARVEDFVQEGVDLLESQGVF